MGKKSESCESPVGISEVTVYYSSWPGDFQEFFRCWQRFQEKGKEIVPSAMKNRSEQDYYTLFRLDGANIPRIYYGNEFCEHRIPNRDELEEAIVTVENAGFSFTFLTPPCGDAGLQRLEELFHRMEKLSPGTEVVANDWGVLKTLRPHYPKLKPVMGRLMSRFLRDPRVTPRYVRPDAPPEAFKALQECSLSIPIFQEILKNYGVERVELDYLFQGIGIDFCTIGLRPSVYIPFGYVTTGRICLFGNLNLPTKLKFELRDACDKPCQKVKATLLDCRSRLDGGVRTYLQRGNTIFYQQNGPMVSEAIAWASQQRARLVFQPDLSF